VNLLINISWSLESVCLCRKVIPLSSFHWLCTIANKSRIQVYKIKLQSERCQRMDILMGMKTTLIQLLLIRQNLLHYLKKEAALIIFWHKMRPQVNYLQCTDLSKPNKPHEYLSLSFSPLTYLEPSSPLEAKTFLFSNLFFCT
jgi:hypothetical protein